MKKYIFLILGLLQFSIAIAQNQNTSIFKHEWAWLGLDFSQVKLVGTEGFNDVPKIKDYYFNAWNVLMETENSKYNIPKILRLSTVHHYPSFFEMRNANTSIEGLVVKQSTILGTKQIEEIVSSYNFNAVKEEIAFMLIVESLNKRDNFGSYWATIVNTKTGKVINTERVTGIPKGFGFRNYWAGSMYDVLKQLRLKKWHKNF
mgnify:CR=1 FL=1